MPNKRVTFDKSVDEQLAEAKKHRENKKYRFFQLTTGNRIDNKLYPDDLFLVPLLALASVVIALLLTVLMENLAFKDLDDNSQCRGPSWLPC